MIRKKTEELESYGQPLIGDDTQLGWQLVQLLNKYTEGISKAIVGSHGSMWCGEQHAIVHNFVTTFLNFRFIQISSFSSSFFFFFARF